MPENQRLLFYHLYSMSLLSLGINHQTAPVDVRERVAFSGDQVDDALRDLQKISAVRESVIVSTCNRTEIYCDLEVDTAQTVSHWLSRYHGMSDDALLPYIYQHTGQEAPAETAVAAASSTPEQPASIVLTAEQMDLAGIETGYPEMRVLSSSVCKVSTALPMLARASVWCRTESSR